MHVHRPISPDGLTQKTSFEAQGQQLAAALAVSNGWAADTAYGGHEKVLRQTDMTLNADTR